VGSRPSRP